MSDEQVIKKPRTPGSDEAGPEAHQGTLLRPHLPRAPSGTEVGSIHIKFHAFFFVFLGVAACAIAGGWAPSPKCC